MLALRRSAVLRLGRAAVSSRNMCAPAVPLVDQIKADLESMKTQVENKVSKGYTPEAYSAAAQAGTVDASLLSATIDFSDEARKTVMKLNMETNKMNQEIATAADGPDFDSWAGKISPEVVSQVKAVFEAELAAAQGDLQSSTEVDDLKKEVTAAFEGSGGLFELASKEEKAAEAGLLQCIADMEKLELDAQGVASVTIAEILEREPELRAQVEDEIKNNVWAP